jgi:hypothetical protein
MPERIDFALEPGVVLFTGLFVVLLAVLIGAVAYPYFTSDVSDEAPDEFVDDTTTDPDVLEQRMDEFVEEMEGERT